MLYPCSASTSDTNPFSKGMRVEIPGKPDENSATVAIPLVVALRPVNNEARVGEQSAVVWKFENVTPISAIRRIVGHFTGPPKMSIVAKPRSSHAISNTFGASGRACGDRYGAQSGVESRMSSAIFPLNAGGIENSCLETVACGLRRGARDTRDCHRIDSRPARHRPGSDDADHVRFQPGRTVARTGRWSKTSTG